MQNGWALSRPCQAGINAGMTPSSDRFGQGFDTGTGEAAGRVAARAFLWDLARRKTASRIDQRATSRRLRRCAQGHAHMTHRGATAHVIWGLAELDGDDERDRLNKLIVRALQAHSNGGMA
jgi:hypothetical protein